MFLDDTKIEFRKEKDAYGEFSSLNIIGSSFISIQLRSRTEFDRFMVEIEKMREWVVNNEINNIGEYTNGTSRE